MGLLKIVGELASWERHSEESINTMLTNLEALRNSGLAEIDD
ncbi:Rifampin ADP-ribosyl transferase (fragment) [Carnobacterium maltaromaticum]